MKFSKPFRGNRFIKMAKIHRIQKEQVIATDIETAWNFIRKPSNLNEITPDALDFTIISDVPDIMHDGLPNEYIALVCPLSDADPG